MNGKRTTTLLIPALAFLLLAAADLRPLPWVGTTVPAAAECDCPYSAAARYAGHADGDSPPGADPAQNPAERLGRERLHEHAAALRASRIRREPRPRGYGRASSIGVAKHAADRDAAGAACTPSHLHRH